MPMFYGYARISHKLQETGDSIDGQVTRAKRRWEDDYQSTHEWGGVFQEPKHVSGRNIPFMKRKAGKDAILKLQQGDALYIDKVDRLWRNIHDFSDLFRWFENHKISLVIGNFMGISVDSNTPMGRWALGSSVLYAQLESDQISDRIRTGFKHERANGFFPRQVRQAPLGTKAVRAIPQVLNKIGKHKRMLIWDTEKRLVMAEIVKLHDVDKMDWTDISDLLTARFQGYMPADDKCRTWNWSRCVYAYKLEKQYAFVQDPRFMDIKMLPTVLEATNAMRNRNSHMYSAAQRIANKAQFKKTLAAVGR